MHFCDFVQDFRSLLPDHSGGGLINDLTGSFGQLHPILICEPVHVIYETCPGQNRCGGHLSNRFGFYFLDQFDFPAFLHQCPLDEIGPAEFVGNGQINIIFSGHIFYHAAVPPGQKSIEISYSIVQLIIFLRADNHHRVNKISRYPSAEFKNLVVGDFLGVSDVVSFQLLGSAAVAQNPRYNQRAEEVPLTGLVDSENLAVIPSINWPARYIRRFVCRF